MATITKETNLVIGIDPGYDAAKVCVNGVLTTIPNNVLDITGHASDFLTLGDKRANDFVLSRYIPDKEYLVGGFARKSIMEKSVRTDEMVKYQMMDSYQRFQTKDFEVNFMTVMGVAIINYIKRAKKTNMGSALDFARNQETGITRVTGFNQMRVIVGVALPNDSVDESWIYIKNFLVGKHKYIVEMSDGVYELEYEVEPNHTMPASQVICAFLGLTSDDNGVMIPNNDTLKKLPALVIDGGYKTMGIFMLTKALKVAQAESNTEFAMGNVHKRVAARLQKEYGRTNIEAFSIPSILENEGGHVNYIVPAKDGGKPKTASVDVNRLVAEEEAALCAEFIDYLNKEFEDLLDVKQIVTTGGTGAAYYNHINAYMEEERNHLSGSVVLTDYEFFGKPLDPVFAIAVGMYKNLQNQIRKAPVRKPNNNTGNNQ